MNLSIIIVSWNVRDLLKGCLKSVFGTTNAAPRDHVSPVETRSLSAALSFEVFVVDNGSQDGTPEMVKKEFPQVRLIVNEKNLGFAKANNQVLEQIIKLGAAPRDHVSPVETRSLPAALPDFVLLLNPDMRVLPGTLQGMVEFMQQHSEAGVAGCHLIDEKGETVPHVRQFPTIRDQIAVILKLPHLFPRVLDKYLMQDFDYDKEAAIDSIRGSFFMIRREVLEKIGFLDERFFVWFEEVDFCQRVKNAGWKVIYNPAVKCVDLVGQSVRKLPFYQKQKMFLESMLKYFWKWKLR